MSLASSRTIVAQHRGQIRQQKQNSWTTIQLKERHRHTSTQLQTNWLPLIQLQCMPLYHKKCIILRIKLPDVVELLAISLSATIRINIMAMTITCAATLTKQADFTIQVIQCFQLFAVKPSSHNLRLPDRHVSCWCFEQGASPIVRDIAVNCTNVTKRKLYQLKLYQLPVVPHKAVAEVSKIGNL